MKTLLDAILFLAAAGLYLGALYKVAEYHHGRALRASGQGSYRAEWDVVFRLAIVVVGVVVCLALYFATRLTAPLF